MDERLNSDSRLEREEIFPTKIKKRLSWNHFQVISCNSNRKLLCTGFGFFTHRFGWNFHCSKSSLPPALKFFTGILRWGWVFLEWTQILSGIQFTTHFIEFFIVETKRFVGSTINVILTRQTCGQRSSRAAESKRRALGNYFFERIWYMFLISKCRGDWHLGLCTTSGLALGEPQRSGDLREKNVFRRRKNRILQLRCGSPSASPEVVHRPRSQSPLHFDIRNIYQICSKKISS